MEHFELAIRTSERSDIRRRLAGQFYTPRPICEQVVDAVLQCCEQRPRVVADPFCGDGRFIEVWLRRAHAKDARILSRLRTILLWDYDGDAIKVAQSKLASTLAELGHSSCVVEAATCDTLACAPLRSESVDLVLTNPPWDLLKPDSRDAVPHQHYEQYIASIRNYARCLAKTYPAAASANGKGIAGYEINLARAGLLACLKLMRPRGVMGIVLPASIFCDQASAPLRRELFSSERVSELNYFPAETRAFVGVDQPFVTLVGQHEPRTVCITVTHRNNDLNATESRKLEIDSEKGEPLPLSLGRVQSEVNELLVRQHSPLRMLEMDMRFGLWLGRELDETRISEAFTTDGVPFLKGRHVGRFEVFEHESPKINTEKRIVPATTAERRLAWRDVSRQNQKRRVQAALVPDGWVTGNSLGVAFFRYGPPNLILCLLGVLNSFVFELQVRSRLLTAHVSLGAMRECAVPYSVFEDDSVRSFIASLVTNCIQQPRNLHCAARLEAAIARAYGLNDSQFAAILDAFPKIGNPERVLLMDEGWS